MNSIADMPDFLNSLGLRDEHFYRDRPAPVVELPRIPSLNNMTIDQLVALDTDSVDRRIREFNRSANWSTARYGRDEFSFSTRMNKLGYENIFSGKLLSSVVKDILQWYFDIYDRDDGLNTLRLRSIEFLEDRLMYNGEFDPSSEAHALYRQELKGIIGRVPVVHEGVNCYWDATRPLSYCECGGHRMRLHVYSNIMDDQPDYRIGVM